MVLVQPISLIDLQSTAQKQSITIYMRRMLEKQWVIWQKEKEILASLSCSCLDSVSSQLILKLLSRATNSRIMVKSDCSIINFTRPEMSINSFSVALLMQILGKLTNQNNWKKMTSYSNPSSPRTKKFQLLMSRWIVIMNAERGF